eukprot:SAG31_NODE_1481_length_8176_cov_3.282531_4_plen_120_part_00
MASRMLARGRSARVHGLVPNYTCSPRIESNEIDAAPAVARAGSTARPRGAAPSSVPMDQLACSWCSAFVPFKASSDLNDLAMVMAAIVSAFSVAALAPDVKVGQAMSYGASNGQLLSHP